MLDQLKKLFAAEPAVKGVLENREPLDLATAALLLEIARSDFSESSAEHDAIRHLLELRFNITAEQAEALMLAAARRADTAVSLHEFTHQLNRELPEGEKIAIVELLWRVSHADGRIDKHEEHMIQRIAGLLHVSDRDRVRSKLKVVVEKGSEKGE